MSARNLTLIALGAATIAVVASMPKLAISAQDRMEMGALGVNQGIYVDRTKFGVIKGTAKTAPTQEQLTKLGAQEVKEGAIIVRVGDKLFLVDTDPNVKSMFSGWAAEAFKGGA